MMLAKISENWTILAQTLHLFKERNENPSISFIFQHVRSFAMPPFDPRFRLLLLFFSRFSQFNNILLLYFPFFIFGMHLEFMYICKHWAAKHNCYILNFIQFSLDRIKSKKKIERIKELLKFTAIDVIWLSVSTS